jgi:DNA-binding GntR family transcriptional regulator
VEVLVTVEPTLAMSEQVAGYLRAQILAGDIAPGERIRQEEVAEQFGTSRLPVREALRMLAAEGLTELEPNKGAWVPLLDAHQVSLLYQMRERLEPLAIIESLPRLETDALAELHDIRARIAADGDVKDFLTLDREFHMLTYSGCQSEQLMSTVTRFWNTTQYYRRLFMQFSGPQRLWIVNAEHGLILDALERRDTEDAERFLAGHIRRTRMELLRHPEIFSET